ncbi:MAG: ABC transporter ATP-binding protein [Spirochaetes bacterium]|nr:ABC transporter ATP-binding protein [Spirochaetota bacterium]
MNGKYPDIHLSVKNLSYSIGKKSIIKSLSLEENSGELIGLIGPNGSGKTTLIKLLSGIIKASSGSVYYNGKSLESLKDRERARLIGYMPQENNYIFHLKVLEVVLFGRYPYKTRMERFNRDDTVKARRMLSYVGLSGYEDRYFDTLSGGEKQLVVFAKVLAQEAKCFFLDEPASNLDISHQEKLFSMASELSRENKIVITAIHNLNIASQYCDRLILIENGSVVKEGNAADVLTTEIISGVYKVNTSVSINTSTGARVISVVRLPAKKKRFTLHLIGGAGSAVNLTRELLRIGVEISGGIAHRYDSDLLLWDAAGIVSYSIPPFSRIKDSDIESAKELVKKADITVLCSFPLGMGNYKNLSLAAEADKLIIVENTEKELQREFFCPEAEKIYKDILCHAVLMKPDKLIDSIREGTV